MTDGPKRTESQELTAVIPREHLPPPSTKLLATLVLDPDHPETVDLTSRAVGEDEDDDCHDRRTAPTMVPCPAGCGSCACCGGASLVTPEQAAEWRIQQADAKGELGDDET